jgi:hypothetical protein
MLPRRQGRNGCPRDPRIGGAAILMSLTIPTGLVVDDAIVMIENIVRFIE